MRDRRNICLTVWGFSPSKPNGNEMRNGADGYTERNSVLRRRGKLCEAALDNRCFVLIF